MKTLLFTLTLIASLSTYAQQSFTYDYDAGGNRIQRKLCTTCTGGNGSNRPANPNDTTSTLAANILPNPTRGNLAIEITETTFVNDEATKTTGADATHYHVLVFDLYGREILNEQHHATQFKIDITKQPPGVYFVKLVSGEKVKQWEIVKD